MPKAVAEVETEYRHEDGTWVVVELRDCVERTVEFVYKASSKAVQNGKAKAGEKGSFDQWRWTFIVRGGIYDGDTFDVDTDPKITSHASNLARIISETFLGEEIEVGQGVDTDLFIGSKIQAQIKNNEPYTKKDGTLGYYSDLRDFAPLGDDQDATPTFKYPL